MQRTPRSAEARTRPLRGANSKRKTITNAAIIGVAFAVLAALGLTYLQSERTQARNAERVAAYTTPTYSAPPEADTALFIGDSYAVGVGADRKAQRWTTLVALEMKWFEANYGLGGTGYGTTAGKKGCGRDLCPVYRDRLLEAVGQISPDVIVISGGQNDFNNYRDDPKRVQTAIRDTYTEAAKAFPKAEIIAVGPSTVWDASPTVKGIDETVQEAAESVGASYVSMLEPPVIKKDMVLADGGHVGPDGHAVIAERIVSTLKG